MQENYQKLLDSLSKPARNALLDKNIDSFVKLKKFTEKEILAIHGIGPKTIPLLEEYLVKPDNKSEKSKTVSKKSTSKSTNPKTDRQIANMNKLYKMSFASIYLLYLEKAEKKGRTREEVNQVIEWLTGYSKKQLDKQVESLCSLEAFFNKAPQINPNADKITGVICGCRVEDIDEPLMQKIRYMDKLIDELAKGKSMDKILRT